MVRYMKTNKKRKKKLTKEEKLKLQEKKEADKFSNTIFKIFSNSGFEHYNTKNWHFDLGGRNNEIDNTFCLENVFIFCEDTTSEDKRSDHLVKKKETFEIILEKKDEFLNLFAEKFPGFDKNAYKNRWKFFYLYFTKGKIDFTSEDYVRYNPIILVKEAEKNYFIQMSSCIKKSFRYEILKFLKIEEKDFGKARPSSSSQDLDVSIIYPEQTCGDTQGVRFVSFMMSPQELIKRAYVLRKDSFFEQALMYQRMIIKNKLIKIRKYISVNKTTFFNNIIVSLPNEVSFTDKNSKAIKLEEITSYEHYNMNIKGGFNSIGIIDGQHRVYGFYEDSNENDELEKEISKYRDELNLLVTGIIFPPSWSDERRRKYESQLFLDINDNAKNINSQLIIDIKQITKPFEDVAIAKSVILNLNERGILSGLFELSELEKGTIKVASVVKYALSKLVSLKEANNGFYKYWLEDGNHRFLKQDDELEELNKYIEYCADRIRQYFIAISVAFKKDWGNKDSKIFKIIGFNGLLIALYKSLKITNGFQNTRYYINVFKGIDFHFSDSTFAYSGSKYSAFADEIISTCFIKESVVAA